MNRTSTPLVFMELDKVEAAVRATMNIIYEWMLLSIAFVMQE